MPFWAQFLTEKLSTVTTPIPKMALQIKTVILTKSHDQKIKNYYLKFF